MKNDLSTAILHIISLVLVIANKLLTKWLNFNQVGSTTLMAEQKLIEQTNCTYKKLYITETHFHNMSTILVNYPNTITIVTTRNALVRWVCVIVTRNIKFSPNIGGQVISIQQGIIKLDCIVSIGYYKGLITGNSKVPFVHLIKHFQICISKFQLLLQGLIYRTCF